MNSVLYGVGLGVALLATPFLNGCSALMPLDSYQMDANDKCLMSHVWEQTTVSTGRPLHECPGWYRERQILDGKAVKK